MTDQLCTRCIDSTHTHRLLRAYDVFQINSGAMAAKRGADVINILV